MYIVWSKFTRGEESVSCTKRCNPNPLVIPDCHLLMTRVFGGKSGSSEKQRPQGMENGYFVHHHLTAHCARVFHASPISSPPPPRLSPSFISCLSPPSERQIASLPLALPRDLGTRMRFERRGRHGRRGGRRLLKGVHQWRNGRLELLQLSRFLPRPSRGDGPWNPWEVSVLAIFFLETFSFLRDSWKSELDSGFLVGFDLNCWERDLIDWLVYLSLSDRKSYCM